MNFDDNEFEQTLMLLLDLPPAKQTIELAPLGPYIPSREYTYGNLVRSSSFSTIDSLPLPPSSSSSISSDDKKDDLAIIGGYEVSKKINFSPQKNNPLNVKKATTIIHQNLTKPRKPPIYQSLPVNLPSNFVKLIAGGINSHDMDTLTDIFNSICLPHTRIIKRLYGELDPQTGRPFNPFGDYSLITFLNVDHFMDYMRDYFRLTPDGLFEVLNYRYVNNDRSSAIIATFRFTATQIKTSEDIEKPSEYHENGLSELTTPVLYPRPFSADVIEATQIVSIGSFAIYLNKQGKISCLEFFYEYKPN